jgi:hypothetical protein
MMGRWAGPALILWAVHLLAKDVIFAFTHGSSEAAQPGTILGLDASQFSVVWTPFPLLAVVGLTGLRDAISTRLGRLGRVGLGIAIGALALAFVANVMQFWILDVDVYFSSPLIFGGWILSVLANLLATLGLVLAGVDIWRKDPLANGRSVLLIIGLVALPTLLLRAWVVGHSDDSIPWRLAYAGLIVPWAIGWARLGGMIVAIDGERRPPA